MAEASTDLRVVKTRRTIKNALIELIAEKELSDITISELSARAQINRKTFYRHYRTVPDVVTELENEILDRFSEILRRGNTSVLDVGAVLRGIGELVEGQREYFRKLLKFNPDLFGGGKIKAMLKKALMVSLKNSRPSCDDKTLSAVSEFVVSGVLSLYAEWFDGGCAGSSEFISDVSARIISGGLRAFLDDEALTAMAL